MFGHVLRSPASPGLRRARQALVAVATAALSSLLLLGLLTAPSRAYAAADGVGLGVAGFFSVLGGSTVTNTGSSVLDSEVGVAPGTAITGFPPGISGPRHRADARAAAAQDALTTAINDAEGRDSDANITANLGGQTLTEGVYTASSSAGLTGTLTLDGQGRSNSVWIFQIGSALTTATNSSVNLIGDAQACNVFWVLDTATVGVGTDFVGTILAHTAISLNTGADVDGRALASTAAVTLDDNTFVSSACTGPTPTASASPSPSPTSASPSPTTASPSPTTASPTPTTASPSPTTASPSPSVSPTSPSPSGSGVEATSTTSASPSSSGVEATSTTSATATTTGANGNSTGNGNGNGNLARTGSSQALSYVAAAGGFLILASIAILIAHRRRPRS